MHDSVVRAGTDYAHVRICNGADVDRDRPGADSFDAGSRGGHPESAAATAMVGASGLGSLHVRVGCLLVVVGIPPPVDRAMDVFGLFLRHLLCLLPLSHLCDAISEES